MKKTGIILAAVFAIFSVFQETVVFAQERSTIANLNFIYGKKELEEDWTATDRQDEIGANFDIRGKNWPISLDFTYLYATQEGRVSEIVEDGGLTETFEQLENEAVTQEISVGLKKIWDDVGFFKPFIGAGASWIRGQLQIEGVDDFDETNLGWYASTGLYFTLIDLINIGVIGRYSDTRIDTAGGDLNAGGWHYGVFAGLHF